MRRSVIQAVVLCMLIGVAFTESLQYKPRKSVWHDNAGISNIVEYAYNAHKLLVKKSHYNGSGELIYYYEYQYNAADQLVKMSEYSLYQLTPLANGYYTYTYDSSGLLTKENFYYEPDQLNDTTLISYDAHRNVIKRENYDSKNTLQWTYLFENTYSASGMLTLVKELTLASKLKVYHSFSYDSAGLLVKKQSFHSSGNLLVTTVFEYDSTPRLVREKNYNSENKQTGFVEYFY